MKFVSDIAVDTTRDGQPLVISILQSQQTCPFSLHSGSLEVDYEGGMWGSDVQRYL